MARTPKPWYREDRDAWYVTIDGTRHKLAEGRKAKRAADAAYHRLMAERRAAGTRAARGVTIAVLCELFVEHLEREKTPLHARTTRERLQKFTRHIGAATIAAELRPHQVTAWLAGTGWNPTTRFNAITTLKSAYNWARKQGLLDASPIAELERPTPRVREEIMDEGQVHRLFAAVRDQPFLDLLTALRETGMRPSEVIRLEAHMIAFDEGVIITKGKGRDRVVYLTPPAVLFFRRLAILHPAGPLLRNRLGNRWTHNAIACRFADIRRITPLGLAGPEVTAESFRHAFITDGLERGVPIATMAELVGHKSTKMIERHYSKLRQRKEHLSEAVRRVRAAPKPQPPTTDT